MNGVGVIRALKGAPISIYVALYTCGDAMTEQMLCTITGYTDKSVSRGLELLQAMGVITQLHHRGPWVINKAIEFLQFGEIPTSSSSSRVNIPVNDEVSTTSYNSEIFRILTEAGVFEPARSEICAMELSPGYIKAHIKAAETVGQAIYRIKHRWDLPCSDCGGIKGKHKDGCAKGKRESLLRDAKRYGVG